MSRIFISYKRVDKEKVFKIKDQIESALDEKCWIDLDGIESDAQFKNVIIRAINKCEVVLFMYSKAHTNIVDFERDWTVRELNFASKKNKRIVFVNLDSSPLSDIFEFDYGAKQHVDGLSQQSLLRLISDLRKWLGKTPVQSDNIKQNKGFSRSINPSEKDNINREKTLTFCSHNIKAIAIAIVFLIIPLGFFFIKIDFFTNLFFNDASTTEDMQTIVCTSCKGSGLVFGKVCSSCGGKGYINDVRLSNDNSTDNVVLPQNGWYYYEDGTFSEQKDCNKICIGVIFGVGKTTDDEIKQGFSKGYIMALNDASEHGVCWGDYGYQTQKVFKSRSSAVADAEGFSHSFLEGQESEGDRTRDGYSAFYHAATYSVKLPQKTSGWYLPSVGQWNMFFQDVLSSSLGERWSESAKVILKEMHFKTAFYWTSTDFGYTDDDPKHIYGDAWNIQMSTKSSATMHTYCRAFVGLARPIAAF